MQLVDSEAALKSNNGGHAELLKIVCVFALKPTGHALCQLMTAGWRTLVLQEVLAKDQP